MRLLFKACCCLLVLAGIVFAQTGGGTITGTIMDPAGAVAPNADIKAKNTATTAEYRTVSTSTGNYNISQLPPGTYEFTYQMVVLQPGEYRVLPARAWQFYFPEVQGIGKGDIFTVE